MFKHILLPTDGSELSLRAADTGIALAARLGASIHAFSVVPPLPTFSYSVDIIQADQAFYVDDAIARAREYLNEVCLRAGHAGVPCSSSHVLDSRPHEAIVAAAMAGQCDLIVMGSHGWRGFDRLLLGSDTHKVIINSDVPVLVCH